MAIRLNESKSCCEHNVIIQGLNCHHTINTCPGSVIHIYKACYLGTKDLTFFDSWIVVVTVHNLVAGFILTPRGCSRTQGHSLREGSCYSADSNEPRRSTTGPGRCRCTKKPDRGWTWFEDPCSREHRLTGWRRAQNKVITGKNRRRTWKSFSLHSQTADHVLPSNNLQLYESELTVFALQIL